jgi:hypothetical protein
MTARNPSDTATQVFLRHTHQKLWYGESRWSEDRTEAKAFGSLQEALQTCRGRQLMGVLVGFNRENKSVYYLKTDLVSEAMINRSAAPLPAL